MSILFEGVIHHKEGLWNHFAAPQLKFMWLKISEFAHRRLYANKEVCNSLPSSPSLGKSSFWNPVLPRFSNRSCPNAAKGGSTEPVGGGAIQSISWGLTHLKGLAPQKYAELEGILGKTKNLGFFPPCFFFVLFF